MLKKKCISCGWLNEPDHLVCSVCGEDLRFAEDVYGEEASPSSGASGAVTGPAARGDSPILPASFVADPVSAEARPDVGDCVCRFPGGVPGGTCFSCGGTIPAAGKADGAGRAEEPEARGEKPRRPVEQPAGQMEGTPSPPSRLNVRLVLPGLGSVALVGDMLVGRGPLARPELVQALSPLRGVSRKHAMILQGTDGIRIMDLGSLNGTWLDNRRLVPFNPVPLSLESGQARFRLGQNLILTLEVAS